MENVNKELQTLLTNGVFKTLISSEAVELAEINAVIDLLIKLGIPFDVSFTKNIIEAPATFILRIALNSTATVSTILEFVIRLNTGAFTR